MTAPLCDRAPDGWWCSLDADHDGPCPARPVTVERLALVRVPVNPEYRPSKWTTPWTLLLGLIGYELWAVATGKPGGPLSHLVWWTYGDRWSLRWWLCSMSLNGLGLWAAAHFMFEWPEVRELGITVAVMLALGVVGWWITR